MRIPQNLAASLALNVALVALCGAWLPAQSEIPPVPPKPQITEQEKAQQEKARQDKAKQDKAKQDKAKQDKAKQDKAKQDKAKQGPKPGEKKLEEIEEEDGPVPAGSDPADLRAQKSAQDMLRAERRLAELLKAGKIKGIDRVLPFEEIASWPYEDGLKGMPKELLKLEGKKVMMTGFMLPIDEVENIKEFLLVQSLWSCCYGQPPDINGTVRVVMTGKKRIDYKFDPIKIVGTFRVKPTIEDGFCVDIYQLESEDVEVIK